MHMHVCMHMYMYAAAVPCVPRTSLGRAVPQLRRIRTACQLQACRAYRVPWCTTGAAVPVIGIIKAPLASEEVPDER